MLFFGHVGITIGVVHAFKRRFKRGIDLRPVAVMAVAPDLLDKPIGLLYPNTFGNHTRLMAHSLVAAILILALLWVRKGRGRDLVHGVLILWGAYLGHFLLDRLWIKDQHALFWPFVPWPPPLEIVPWVRWWNALSQPYTLAGEILGISILVFLAVKYRLHRPKNARAFLRTGVLGER